MTYGIHLSGSGTRQEIITSLLSVCQEILVPNIEVINFEDKTLAGEFEQIEDLPIKIDEFLLFNQSALVKVHNDDKETGDYRLLETEKNIAADYENRGHKVFSIMENQTTDEEMIEPGINTSCYCIGYLICKL